MADPRYTQLADVLVNYSCRVQAGENVLVEAIDTPIAFIRALVRKINAAGGNPLVSQRSNAVMRDLMLSGNADQMQLIGEIDTFRMSKMQAYIGVRGHPNISEWSDIPAEKMQLYQKLWWSPTHIDVRVKNTKWVVLRWPNAAMAQQAQLSTESFEDFFFRVCTMDYERMTQAMQPLRELMENTDRVHLKTPQTDLHFSIRNIPAICCGGSNNIPDGEVFTAPVRDSVEGTIVFNAPTIYQGTTHENIRLEFAQGRIVHATSSNTTHLEKVLATDEGARYVGEFAIGFNPHIQEPMKDILFDEKIAGSIHFTPGNAYEEADNGNRSDIHWDMVLLMTPEMGGGEIFFDDRLIRQDGRFVLPELAALNPENLLA